MIEGNVSEILVFEPDMAADIYEKWIGFLAIVASAIALGTADWNDRLRHCGRRPRTFARPRGGAHPDAARRLRAGHSAGWAAGNTQKREEANELAQTLSRLSRDNRSLLRKIVSLQDDERRDLARELHDELGPLLFGIRANAVTLLDTTPRDKAQLDASVGGLVQSVEALQQANRRILDRLRPLYIDELGLAKSIETLLRNARSQAPQLQQTTDIDPRLGDIDGLLSHTVYRVIQEGVTNVLRHAKASAMKITATLQSDQLFIEVAETASAFRRTMSLAAA